MWSPTVWPARDARIFIRHVAAVVARHQACDWQRQDGLHRFAIDFADGANSALAFDEQIHRPGERIVVHADGQQIVRIVRNARGDRARF